MSLRFNTGAMQYRESPSDNWQPLVIQANMNWASMADIYDPVNGSYEYGEYVLYGGAMYRCISTTGASGAWDSTKWTSVSVGDELASFIIISDTQPTETSNKIWIKESSAQDPVQIPTMAEFSALESDVVDISDDVDAIENTLNTKADEESLALRRTGATNTGVQIENGTYFYLDGTLKRAIATIAQNASFTAQNCETVTAGGLNELNNKISSVSAWSRSTTGFNTNLGTGYCCWVRYGDLVIADITCMNTTAGISESDIIAFAPNGFKPKTTYNTQFASWDVTGAKALTNAFADATITIDKNGYVKQGITNLMSVGSAFHFHFVYEAS